MAGDKGDEGKPLGLDQIETEGRRVAAKIARQQFDERRKNGEIVDPAALARFGPSVIIEYLLIADEVAARALAAQGATLPPPSAANVARMPPSRSGMVAASAGKQAAPRKSGTGKEVAASGATQSARPSAASKSKQLAAITPPAKTSAPATQSTPSQKIARVKVGWADQRKVKLDALTEAMRDGALVLLALGGVILAALRLLAAKG